MATKIRSKEGRFVAYVCGIFRKEIVTGDLFKILPKDEQEAVIAHELGHIAYKHMRIRWRWFFTLRWLHWSSFLVLMREQELQADEFAAKGDHGRALIRFLQRLPVEAHPFYPTPRERILRLRRLCFGE